MAKRRAAEAFSIEVSDEASSEDSKYSHPDELCEWNAAVAARPEVFAPGRKVHYKLKLTAPVPPQRACQELAVTLSSETVVKSLKFRDLQKAITEQHGFEYDRIRIWLDDGKVRESEHAISDSEQLQSYGVLHARKTGMCISVTLSEQVSFFVQFNLRNIGAGYCWVIRSLPLALCLCSLLLDHCAHAFR